MSATNEFNLGIEDDFRVPDLGFVSADEESQRGLHVPSASIVIEIVSPMTPARPRSPST
jgi:hypothetical protein